MAARIAGMAAICALLLTSLGAAAHPVKQAEEIVKQSEKLEAAGEAGSAKSLLTTTAQQYQAAVQKSPADGQLWFALAIIQAQLQDDEQALKSIDQAIRLQPTSGMMRALRGVILVTSDQMAKAEPEFKKAIQLEPQNIEIRVFYASALASVERTVEAEAEIKQAVAINARHPQAIIVWGLLQVQNGKPDAALGTLRAGVQLQPQDFELREALALTLHGLGHHEEAYDHNCELYKVNREHGLVVARLVLLATELKRTDEAEAYVTQLYLLHRQRKYQGASFSRGKFAVGNKTVAAVEHFESSEDSPAKYLFYVEDERGRDESTVMLMTARKLNSFYPKAVRDESKPISALVQVEEGKQKHYGAFSGQPTYEQTQRLVRDILEGKLVAAGARPAAKPENALAR